MRRENDLALANLPARLGALEVRYSTIESDLATNTVLTRQVFDNTKALIDGVQAAASFWAFMSRNAARLRLWSFHTAKWVGAVTAAIVGVWAVAKGVFNVDLSAYIVHWWNE